MASVSALSRPGSELCFDETTSTQGEVGSNADSLNSVRSAKSIRTQLRETLQHFAAGSSTSSTHSLVLSEYEVVDEGRVVGERHSDTLSRQVEKPSLLERVRRVCGMAGRLKALVQQRVVGKEHGLWPDVLNFCKRHQFVSLLLVCTFAFSIALTAGASAGFAALAFSPTGLYLAGKIGKKIGQACGVPRWFANCGIAPHLDVNRSNDIEDEQRASETDDSYELNAPTVWLEERIPEPEWLDEELSISSSINEGSSFLGLPSFLCLPSDCSSSSDALNSKVVEVFSTSAKEIDRLSTSDSQVSTEASSELNVESPRTSTQNTWARRFLNAWNARCGGLYSKDVDSAAQKAVQNIGRFRRAISVEDAKHAVVNHAKKARALAQTFCGSERGGRRDFYRYSPTDQAGVESESIDADFDGYDSDGLENDALNSCRSSASEVSDDESEMLSQFSSRRVSRFVQGPSDWEIAAGI